jgi:hypothetical protein
MGARHVRRDQHWRVARKEQAAAAATRKEDLVSKYIPAAKTPPTKSADRACVFLYGPPKIGKSTFAAGADAHFLECEPGLDFLDVFKTSISSWVELCEAVKEITAAFRVGNYPHKTIALDTVDVAFVLCQAHVLGKHRVQHESDLEFGKGWGLVENEFRRLITDLCGIGPGVIMISHAEQKEVKDIHGAKSLKIVPTLPKNAREVALPLSDIILFADIHGGKRVLRTKPSRDHEAGDRSNRLPDPLDLSYPAFLAAMTVAGAEPDLTPCKRALVEVCGDREAAAAAWEKRAPKTIADAEALVAEERKKREPPTTEKLPGDKGAPFTGTEELAALKAELNVLLGVVESSLAWQVAKLDRKHGDNETQRRQRVAEAEALVAKHRKPADRQPGQEG